MRILAIETSVLEGSLAALENTTLLDEIPLNSQLRTTRTLTPGMQELLHKVGWRPADVQCVCVSIGPGSFTGLRIGVTAAKAFAYATKAAICGVSTLQVLAAQVPLGAGPLWALLNAERGQVYASEFTEVSGTWTEISPPRIADAAELFQSLAERSRVTGPALRDFADSIPPHVICAEESCWKPRAATVGQLGFRKTESGRFDDLWSLLPFYLRDSAAQEKAKSKQERL